MKSDFIDCRSCRNITENLIQTSVMNKITGELEKAVSYECAFFRSPVCTYLMYSCSAYEPKEEEPPKEEQE